MNNEEKRISNNILKSYGLDIEKGRGTTKKIGELDKSGKNIKTANGWVPVKKHQAGGSSEPKEGTIASIKKVARSLGIPNDPSGLSDFVSWTKRGGYAGEKKVGTVSRKAIELGWKEESDYHDTHPANGNTSKGTIFISPDGKFKLDASVYFGETASKNAYGLMLKRVKEPETKGDGSGLLDKVKENLRKEKPLTAAVIAVGVINMNTGMTGHGWSIYENKGMHAFLTDQGSLLLGNPKTFEVGNKDITLRDNDSNRRKEYGVEIIDKAPCNKDELLSMLEKHRYHYKPLKAFRKRPEGSRKLRTSYSVKGTDHTENWRK